MFRLNIIVHIVMYTSIIQITEDHHVHHYIEELNAELVSHVQMKRAFELRGHTFPTALSDNWRVQAFDKLIDPSLKETASPEVAVECGEI